MKYILHFSARANLLNARWREVEAPTEKDAIVAALRAVPAEVFLRFARRKRACYSAPAKGFLHPSGVPLRVTLHSVEFSNPQ